MEEYNSEREEQASYQGVYKTGKAVGKFLDSLATYLVARGADGVAGKSGGNAGGRAVTTPEGFVFAGEAELAIAIEGDAAIAIPIVGNGVGRFPEEPDENQSKLAEDAKKANASGKADECPNAGKTNSGKASGSSTYKGGRNREGDTRHYATREQAMNAAKDRAGVPRSQQPNRQWVVGDDINKKGCNYANYEYSSNETHHGRYYEYDTPNGKVVIVEHTNDGLNHFHAGEVSPAENYNRHLYDFKIPGNDYYPINGTHYYYYYYGE